MTAKEIRQWMDELWSILVDLNISINNAKRLFESKYLNEEKIKKHGFLQHHWYQLRFIIIIQLAKLVSDRNRTHKRNIFHLCGKLERTDFNNDFFKELAEFQPSRYFEHKTTEETIKNLILSVRKELSEHQDLIKKIIDARDQTYAHNDPIPNKKIPAMKDLEIMIKVCNNLYNSISGELFKSHTGFEHTGDWDIDYILRELSDMRTERLDKIEKLKE
jgi:hypothetical protein